MCMLNRRTQILLDKDMWNKIVKSAKAQNISAGEYIRRAVIEYIDNKNGLQGKESKIPFKSFFKTGRH